MKTSEVKEEHEKVQKGLNKLIKEMGGKEEPYNITPIGYLDITEDYEKGIVSQTFVNKLKQIWGSGIRLGSMGHHICEFCETKPRATSSSEKTLIDKENNIKYIFPEMIFHYMEVHEFKPSNEFIKFVMNYKIEQLNISQVFDEALAKQTDKNISKICKNGYKTTNRISK